MQSNLEKLLKQLKREEREKSVLASIYAKEAHDRIQKSRTLYSLQNDHIEKSRALYGLHVEVQT